MKIKITGGGRDLGFTIPNALVLNGITARIACAAARKHAPEAGNTISADTIGKIFAELNRIKKKNGEWVLVEVKSAAGEQVEISI